MSNSKRIRGIAIARPIVYGNVAVLMKPEERVSEHTHKWTVAVRSAASPEPSAAPHEHLESDRAATATETVQAIGGQDDISYFVRRVTFKLHDTYANPTRTVDKPPFELTETGWGEFEIQIKIFFTNESGEKPITINHLLKLHPWPLSLTAGPNNLTLPEPVVPAAQPLIEPVLAELSPATTAGDETMDVDAPAAKEETKQEEDAPTEEEPALAPVFSPVHSWQYDEIVFNEPTESFYATLVSYNLTPLPPDARLPKPSARLPIGSSGAIGELTQATEALEAKRLEEARKAVLIELEKMRTRLIEGERGLQEARRELLIE